MKRLIPALAILALAAACGTSKQDTEVDVAASLDYCAGQVRRSLVQLRGDSAIDYTMMPRNMLNTDTVWNCRKAVKEEWCAGFWPGVLWYDYEHTRDESIRAEAERFTESLEFLSRTPAFDHDLGFLVFCSYGNGYRLTHNPRYKEVILAAADTLATLFNPAAGTILSWPRNVAMLGGHNTIMDNMINLEMLFWAAKNGGSHRLYDIARTHAETTMHNQFRPDYTCYHVAVYDSITGKLDHCQNHQGLADSSMWARGQAWAIYGYTMVYRETNNKKFLDFAQKVADAYLSRLPEDMIPYWDFDDPAIPNAPRDASAACVVASALIELSGYVDQAKGEAYLADAEKMLSTLSGDNYRCGAKKPAFLCHSVGNMPANYEIDASIIYADYYYIEALTRLKRLDKGEPVTEYYAKFN